MDEEANFERLLSASGTASRPSFYQANSTDADPWGNPFSAGASDGWGAASSLPPAPAREDSEPDTGFGGESYSAIPDPPSVIAAREREELAASSSGGFEGGFGTDPYAPSPFGSPPRAAPTFGEPSSSSPISPQRSHAPADRTLPAGLIDEDLLAERDPEESLKRAFKKSAAPQPAAGTPDKADKTKGAYVFRPKHDKRPSLNKPPAKSSDPTAVPLPESAQLTPTGSRPSSPGPAPATSGQNERSPLGAPTPADRVSVSPLETPGASGGSDYGFRSLALGASGDASNGASPPKRFGAGRGWGVVEADDAPLSSGGGDPWNEGGGGGWSEPGPLAGGDDESVNSETPVASPAASGPSRSVRETSTPGTPRRSKLLNTPVFQITVSNPTKVGDPVRGHVIYTVQTKTTSPHYRRGDFSVLRRFSDFLWLFEALSQNNPGVIVPPVPDKHAFGRFQDQFIETRRSALQRCLGKMTSHPILQLDPDLRLFLESDTFALDIKNRRAASPDANSGLLSSWTGPRYTEQDEWFDNKRAYLDHLEGQLKGLSKSLDAASKTRLDMAMAMGDFADSAAALADSDLGAAMCAALGRLADLARKEKTTGEEQAKSDVSQLLNLADEYVRFIASVRLAFHSRVKTYHAWQAAEKEVGAARKVREKARQQGRPVSLAELPEAERRARDAAADFDAQSKLVKAEFARFERERVDEFKRTLSAHLDMQIERQRELVTAWEEYHAMLLKMVQRAQAQQQALAQQ